MRLLSGLLVLPVGCIDNAHDVFQGYVEGEYIQVASPLSGQLESLSVRRGGAVTAGDPLFRLEHSRESAALSESEQELARVTSELADMTKGLRPTEVQSIEARLKQTQAAHSLAQKEYDRLERLVNQQQVSRESYDRAASQLEQTAAAIQELTAELETAGLGARSDALAAVRAEVRAARERVRQTEWQLRQKKQTAPESALVFDTYYSEGEFVPAGFPVVSLLPAGRIKIRFFVPESVVGSLRTGKRIDFKFDGAPRTYSAAVSYISPKAEYTPPVIYSREARSKLVFMIEAIPEPADAASLHPGQPVDVRLVNDA